MTSETAIWIKRALRRAPQPVRFRWHRLVHHGRLIRDRGLRPYLHWQCLQAFLWARATVRQRRYVVLTDDDLRRSRRSSKVFVFGSGYSLNDLTALEWAHFSDHDVFGFSGFIYQQWVRTDYHLIRGWNEDWTGLHRCIRSANDYARTLNENRRFDRTVLVLQGDFTATFANALLAEGLLRPSLPIYRYRTARRLDNYPSASLRLGVTHGPSVLLDAVNVAYIMGWSEIVMVGVDLYDSRYFWAPGDATLVFSDGGSMVPSASNERGIAWNETHSTVHNGVIQTLRTWADVFRRDGVRLSVYNPRSLLAGVLPVYCSAP